MQTIEQRFRTFHRENPHVLDTLIDILDDWNRATHGRPWSIWGAYQVARWQRRMQTTSLDSFKLSNDYTTFYARLIAHRRPELGALLKTKATIHARAFLPETVVP